MRPVRADAGLWGCRQARIARDGNPAIVHTDPLTGAETSLDLAELVGLSPAEAKAYVAHFAVYGTPPPEGADWIEPHAYLDPFGRWRMSDTNEPVWPGEAGEPLSPGQYIDLQGRRRWSDNNQYVEQFPNRSQYQNHDGIWRWADTGHPIFEDEGGDVPRHVEVDGEAIDRGSIARTISIQRQGRHLRGDLLYNGGGYFVDAADAQAVLDAFHNGWAEVLGISSRGHVVVMLEAVVGFNNNEAVGCRDQPRSVFLIKGTSRPSIVPTNPNWSPLE